MINTLRITTIIAAVLAVIFLILSMVLGGRSNRAIEQFLNSSGVVEKYNIGAENNAKTIQDQVPPLVTQAEIFVQYLNPPPPEPAIPEAPEPTISQPRPISPPTAKFTLVGTSVYAARPELSLAFINEPGTGSRWVRQGSQVEHLTIKEVKDGLIVLQDGQRTFEIATQERPETSLVENPSPVSSEVISGISSRPKAATSHEPVLSAVEGSDAATIISTPTQPRIDQDALEKFIESLQASTESGEIDPQNVNKFLSALGSMRISDDEAEKLKDLPKEQLSPEPIAGEPNSSQQPSPVEDERITGPEQNPQQSTTIKTPVDYKERLTAEPNQAKNPKVRRPVGLPKRPRRNR